MTTSTKCRAKTPATCTDPNCPEKRAAREVFYSDASSAPKQWVEDALENDAQQLSTLKKIRRNRGLRTPIMGSTDISLDSVPQHANLLAVVKASPQPIAYDLLVSIVKSQRAVEDEFAVKSARGESVEGTIHSIVMDLKRTGVVDAGPSGLYITDEGKSMISRWGAYFTQRTEHTAAVIDGFKLPTATL